MNKSLLLLVAAALSFQSAYGLGGLFQKAKETVAGAKALIDKPKEYQAGARPGDKQFTPTSIEIKNKGQDRIWVAIKTGAVFYQQGGKDVTQVAPGMTQAFTADISQPYEVFVWTSEPASSAVAPTKHYKINANETGYLTADPGGSLRPQTGPLEGRLGKTDTGLSLARNVRTLTPVV